MSDPADDRDHWKAVAESGEQDRLEARAQTALLRRIIYKLQMPENANKFGTEFLTHEEMAAYKLAIALSI